MQKILLSLDPHNRFLCPLQRRIIGLQNKSTGNYIFCHDGSRSNISEIDDTRNTCVSPVLLKALEIIPEELSETSLNDIYDEYQIQANPEVRDLRTQMMGQLIADLPQMPLGKMEQGNLKIGF